MRPQRCSLAALWALQLPVLVDSFSEELYTTNAFCRQKFCINPVFPGLDQFQELEEMRFVKYLEAQVKPHLEFCRPFLDYDPGLPASTESGISVMDKAQQQDKAASKLYFYHLSGMGIEPWDHPRPNELLHTEYRGCARAVARMVCFTMFPQGPVYASNGSSMTYVRPCKSSCQNYLEACQVECCDNSPTCVFEHETTLQNGTILIDSGYVDRMGPSKFCTGMGHRASFSVGIAIALLSFVLHVPISH
mmetsp:Transcript_62122/g.115244  ORF Transcript_62122/g.115244 Transcript_62122/m.115244 type:complete len:248 (+) Transcript_62122:124-867(+)